MKGSVFKALGDPTRRKILELLSKEGDMTAGQIAAHFSITAPSVSHHLSTLKASGLVLDTRRGQTIVYSLNTTVFQEMLAWFYNFTQEEGPHE